MEIYSSNKFNYRLVLTEFYSNYVYYVRPGSSQHIYADYSYNLIPREDGEIHLNIEDRTDVLKEMIVLGISDAIRNYCNPLNERGIEVSGFDINFTNHSMHIVDSSIKSFVISFKNELKKIEEFGFLKKQILDFSFKSLFFECIQQESMFLTISENDVDYRELNFMSSYRVEFESKENEKPYFFKILDPIEKVKVFDVIISFNPSIEKNSNKIKVKLINFDQYGKYGFYNFICQTFNTLQKDNLLHKGLIVVIKYTSPIKIEDNKALFENNYKSIPWPILNHLLANK